MNNSIGQKRVRYWDIVKGITIILMILGHQNGIPEIYRSYIFSFHMPIFFVANAYFIKKYDVKSTFVKSAKSLIKPYVIVCLLSALVASFAYSGSFDFNVLLSKIKAMFGGVSYTSSLFTYFESVWQVWFVACLFVSRNVYVFVMKYIEKIPDYCRIIILFAISYLGVWLGERQYWLLWSTDVALASIIFMWFGDMLHRKEVLNSKWFKSVAIVSAIVWYSLCSRGYWIELSIRSYKGGVLCYLCAIAGSVTVIAISMLIDYLGSLKYGRFINCLDCFFAWAGKESMVILAVHLLGGIYFSWIIPSLFAHYNEYIWVKQFIIRLCLILICTVVYTMSKSLVIKLREQLKERHSNRD